MPVSRGQKRKRVRDQSTSNDKNEQERNPSTSWICHVCTLKNPLRKKRCDVCETRRLPSSFLIMEDIPSSNDDNNNNNNSNSNNENGEEKQRQNEKENDDNNKGKVVSWLSKRKKRRQSDNNHKQKKQQQQHPTVDEETCERQSENMEEQENVDLPSNSSKKLKAQQQQQNNNDGDSVVTVRITSKDFNDIDILQQPQKENAHETALSPSRKPQRKLQAIIWSPFSQQGQARKCVAVRIQSKDFRMCIKNNVDNNNNHDSDYIATTTLLDNSLPSPPLLQATCNTWPVLSPITGEASKASTIQKVHPTMEDHVIHGTPSSASSIHNTPQHQTTTTTATTTKSSETSGNITATTTMDVEKANTHSTNAEPLANTPAILFDDTFVWKDEKSKAKMGDGDGCLLPLCHHQEEPHKKQIQVGTKETPPQNLPMCCNLPDHNDSSQNIIQLPGPSNSSSTTNKDVNRSSSLLASSLSSSQPSATNCSKSNTILLENDTFLQVNNVQNCTQVTKGAGDNDSDDLPHHTQTLSTTVPTNQNNNGEHEAKEVEEESKISPSSSHQHQTFYSTTPLPPDISLLKKNDNESVVTTTGATAVGFPVNKNNNIEMLSTTTTTIDCTSHRPCSPLLQTTSACSDLARTSTTTSQESQVEIPSYSPPLHLQQQGAGQLVMTQQDEIGFSQIQMTQQAGAGYNNFEYTPQSQDRHPYGNFSNGGSRNSHTQHKHGSISSPRTTQLTQRLNKWLDNDPVQVRPTTATTSILSNESMAQLQDKSNSNSETKVKRRVETSLSSLSRAEPAPVVTTIQNKSVGQDASIHKHYQTSTTTMGIPAAPLSSFSNQQCGMQQSSFTSKPIIEKKAHTNKSQQTDDQDDEMNCYVRHQTVLQSQDHKADVVATSRSYHGGSSSKKEKNKSTMAEKAKMQLSEGSLATATQLLSKEPLFTSKQFSKDTCLKGTKSGSVGFATAGKGKKIIVSEESLAKASQLLQQQQNPPKQDQSSTNLAANTFDKTTSSTGKYSAPAVLFQTAGKGQTIHVSEESLGKATELLKQPIPGNVPQGLPASIVAKSSQVIVSNISSSGLIDSSSAKSSTAKSSMHNPVTAFATAGSGKRIPVTEESIAKASSLLQMSSESTEPQNRFARSENQISTPAIIFQTAGREREVQDSKDSFDKTGRLPKEASVTNPTLVAAFTTAGNGMNIAVSEESMAKASNLMQISSQSDTASSLREAVLLQGKSIPKFQRAGLTATLQASEDSFDTAVNFVRQSTAPNPPVHIPVAAFATAGTGRKISVSEESMAKASNLLHPSSDPKPCGSFKEADVLCADSKFRKSSSGATLQVSENSLDKADGFFNESIVPESYSTVPMTAFATGDSGRQITISEESVPKASKLLQVTSETKRDGSSKEAELPHEVATPIFQTPVSRETLQLSEKPMDEADRSSNKLTVSVAALSTTGSRKKFTVTEGSMANTSNLLERSSEANEHNIPYGNNHSKSHLILKESFAARAVRTKSTGIVAFATAGSGTKITVSEESIAKASNLLEGTSMAPETNTSIFESGKNRSRTQVSGDSIDKAGKMSNEPFAAISGRTKSTGIVAFATAGSGKKITVSEESIAKASNLLEGTSMAPETNTSIFESGKNRSRTQVSGDSIDKAVKMLNDPPSVQAGRTKSTGIVAFATAGSGTKITVSEESIAKASNLLEGTSKTSEGSTPIFESGKYGSGIQVSGDSIAKAGKVLNLPPSVQDGGSTPTGTVAFATAGSGTQITVSEESIAKASNLLEGTSKTSEGHTPIFESGKNGSVTQVFDDSLAKAGKVLNSPPSVQDGGSTPAGIVAFATAGSGKKITVSEESIVKASNLLKTSEGSTPIFENGTYRSRTQLSSDSIAKAGKVLNLPPSVQDGGSTPTGTVAFATAGSGTQITVSEESIAKASNLFGDTSMAPETNTSIVESGKNRSRTQVSGDSLDKAGKLLDIPSSVQAGRTKSTGIVAFATAGSGTKITISEESIAKASNLLEGTSKTSETSTPIFESGKNRSRTQVSGDSIDKAGKLLNDQPSVQAGRTKSTGIVAFATAGSGTKITVSEESIAKASNLLEGTSKTSEGSTPISESGKNGSGIQVSGDSLAKAGKVLNSQPSVQDGGSTPTGIVAFATAGSGTKITASEESIAKASNLLEDTSPETSTLIFESGKNGTGTQVFDDSLAKAGKVLNEPPSVRACESTPAGIVTFATAGNERNITVSEESLAKASNLLEGTSKTSETSTAMSCQPGTKTVNEALPDANDYTCSSHGASIGATKDLAHLPNMSASIDMHLPTKLYDDAYRPSKVQFSASSTEEVTTALNELNTSSTTGQTKSVYLYEPAMPNIFNHPGDGANVSAPEERISKGSELDSRPCEPEKVVVHIGETPRLTTSLSVIENQTPMTRKKEKETISTEADASFLNNAVERKEIRKPGTSSIKRHGSTFAVSSCTSVVASFTPHQTPAFRKPVVTMSTSVKNPYLRKRNNDAMTFDQTEAQSDISPVPFKFRHIEGSFRGKQISPNSISYAENLLSGSSEKPCESEASSSTPRILNFSSQTPHRGQIATSISPGFDDKVRYCATSDMFLSQDLQRISLSKLASFHGKMASTACECVQLGVDTTTTSVDSMNATALRFDRVSGLPCTFIRIDEAPGGRRIGSVEDFHQSLVDRGCNSNLLQKRWISNHVRWIVWKLAATERRFPALLARKYLTYENVVVQLHKRYEKEICGGKRPALRKILNRDIASSRLITLCVSQVCMETAEPNSKTDDKYANKTAVRLELTDGWYSVQASLDQHLIEFVKRGRIAVGTKLTMCNVLMNGADDGIDPLDDSYVSFGENCPVLFDLAANSTRLAKWDTKLGFVASSLCSQHGLLQVKALSDIIPGGGNIPLVDLIICRRYPRLYVVDGIDGRTGSSELDGRSKILTDTQEEKARKNFEKHRQKAIEKIHEQVRKDCEKDVDELSPEIWKSLIRCESPEEFYEKLSRRERSDIDRWKEKRSTLLQDRVRKEIEAEMECDDSLTRVSTPFIRLRVKTSKPSRPLGDTDNTGYFNACEDAILTIHRVSEEQLSFLTEGSVVRFQNLAVRSTKFEGSLHLSTCAKTKMEKLPSKLVRISPATFHQRYFVSLFRVTLLSKKLMKKLIPSFPAPEVDLAGISLKTVRSGNDSKVFYLTDETGLLLRVHRDEDHSEYDTLQTESSSSRKNLESISTIAFKDLRVMPFDPIENCAVAIFSQTSSVALKSASRRKQELQKWATSISGKAILVRIAACFDAGIPMMEHRHMKIQVAVGYIVGFTVSTTNASAVRGGESHAQLQVMVDCGGEALGVWDFPLFLLDEALRLCSSNSRSGEGAAASLEEERIHLSLKHLGRLFRGSGTLLHFVLQQRKKGPQSLYEVRQLKVADPLALSHAYASAHALDLHTLIPSNRV